MTDLDKPYRKTPIGVAVAAFDGLYGEVNELEMRFRALPVRQIPLPMVLTTTTIMAQTIGDVVRWVRENIQQTHIPKAVEFVLDTVRFAMTGKRRFSINMWVSIFQDQEWVESKSTREYCESLTVGLPLITLEDLLSNWLQQPNGDHDMLISAILMHKEFEYKTF